jgi:hypothetical protein
MSKDYSIVKFGEDIEGYNIPVLNEREIRASAGIMFLLLFSSYMFLLFKQIFLPVKYMITLLLVDFIIRVLLSPRFSPFLIIGRWIVSQQVPEYVGAPQKKFAWKIGLALSSLMFFLLIILNAYSVITAISCLVCLLFLFFESAFGICLGCIVYGLLYKKESRYCAGETCTRSKKEAIQRVSRFQVFCLAGFALCVLLAILFLQDRFSEAPKNLWEMF